MQDRLAPLCFLPPPTGMQWIGPPREQDRYDIKRANGEPVSIELPLFWNEPFWYRTDTETADMLATAVATDGIVVSALARDLKTPEQSIVLFDDQRDEDADPKSRPKFLPRIVPYRPERYGLDPHDFDGANFIDLRLRVCGDWSGRFAYSAGQIDRWEGDPDGDPPAGGSWAPAGTFPPDVASLEQLGSKIGQLRALSPDAAIFVSMTPHRMDAEIPKIIAAKPDGIILILDELPLSGMELAQMTRHARRTINGTGASGFPLWIAPGPVSAEDAVKLVVLGASGIAIDHWCRDLVEKADDTIENSPTARLGQERQWELDFPLVQELVRETLSLEIERFRGLIQRMRCLPSDQRLGSLDRQWARMFDVPWVSIGRAQEQRKPPQPTEKS